MELDPVTYTDLSIFHSEEEYSIFHLVDKTCTSKGKEQLLKIFKNPLQTIEQIREQQEVIRIIREYLPYWPGQVTNGTIMVLEKFFDTHINPFSSDSSPVQSWSYRAFHAVDYTLTRYTLTHFRDFLAGLDQITKMIDSTQTPLPLKIVLEKARWLCEKDQVQELVKRNRTEKFLTRDVVHFGHFLHERFREHTLELMVLYGKLDAWFSMALAMQEHQWVFPEWMYQEDPHVEAEGLVHPLVHDAVPYDIQLDPKNNFLFLTGANMAGKSTFIKAVGVSVFLAHLGMGVPAKKMKMTLFDGILSNINVMDNIVKGESYFFNEVKRIRDTILRINDGRNWLVLIDELFKGTNIQDAMKCSTTVIEGLIRIRHSLFILSTHLYEIGDDLKKYPNIAFKYFETKLEGDQLVFSYHLKEGISQDRMGYLILKREKVVELLEKL